MFGIVKKIVDNPVFFVESLKKRGFVFDPDEIISLYNERKKLLFLIENSNAKHNKLSLIFADANKKKITIDKKVIEELKCLKKEKNDNELRLKELEQRILKIVSEIPNLPDEDLKIGGKENNEVIHVYNKPKNKKNFKLKDHVELAQNLCLIDYNRAAKISGRNTWIYINEGAELEWALINFFIHEHLKNGYSFSLLPHIVHRQASFGAGHFPKFKNDIFKIEKEDKYLISTAETVLVNLHSNEILKQEDLNKKYFAFTPCYRKEVGSYRTEERGMIRGFQFNKVEMVQFSTESESDKSFNDMLNIVIDLVKKLGLHFRVTKLAAGDCSFSMARTYDVEVFLPSIGIYKEVSSISNARDYQSRRNNTKYRDKDGKLHFCHILNASGLATSRIFPAILEQFQRKDGSVVIPKVLRPYMRNKKVILKK
ncbi:MAG: serine--tRNA ligase [Bacilli bacterium]|nr:serine--tRNA ligase [Bacilli bacterium]